MTVQEEKASSRTPPNMTREEKNKHLGYKLGTTPYCRKTLRVLNAPKSERRACGCITAVRRPSDAEGKVRYPSALVPRKLAEPGHLLQNAWIQSNG